MSNSFYPPAGNTLYPLLSVGAVALMHVALIWAFPFVPTQDGPVHQETTAILARLLSGEAFWQNVYVSNWSLRTNQVYHSLLLALNQVVTLPVAERLALSAYALLFAGTVLFSLRLLRGRAAAALLTVPLLFSYVFHMGFFNLCFGYVLYPVTLALYLRQLGRSSWRSAALLALLLSLTYYVHIVAAFVSLVSVALMHAGWLLRRDQRVPQNAQPALRQTLQVLCALAPGFYLVAAFIFSSSRVAHPATSFLTPGRLLLSSFAPEEIVRNVARLLVTHGYLDLFVYLPWAGLFALSALWAARRAQRGVGNLLLLPALSLLTLSLLVPDRLGEIGFLVNRLAPFSALAFVMWLGLQRLSKRQWRTLQLSALSLSVVTAGYLASVFAGYSETLTRYTAAASSARAEQFMLPVQADSRKPWQRVQPLHHAASYVALERGLVNFRNYQASKPYFPVTFRSSFNPYVQLGTDVRIESPPYTFAPERFQQQTGCPLTYLLLWQNAAPLLPEGVADNYVPVYAQAEATLLERRSSTRCQPSAD